MGFRITFTDTNVAEEGHNIYRSETSMAGLLPSELPPPIATLGPDVSEWEDGTVTPGGTFYYRVGAFTVGGTVEMVGEEFEAVAIEVPPHVYFARRSSTVQPYEQAVADHFQARGFGFTFVAQGLVGTISPSPQDMLVVGAPGTEFVAHPEAALLNGFACPVVSMCRHTSINALDMGSSSGAQTGATGMVIQEAFHPLLQALGYPLGATVALGSSATGHRFNTMSAGTTRLAGFSNATGSACLAVREGPGGFPRYHLGYYRGDLATPDFFRLLRGMLNIEHI